MQYGRVESTKLQLDLFGYAHPYSHRISVYLLPE